MTDLVQRTLPERLAASEARYIIYFLMFFAAFMIFSLINTPMGRKRMLLVLIPLFMFGVYAVGWSLFILIPFAILWVLVLLGTARVSVWEMKECSERATDWWTPPHVLGVLVGLAAAAFGTWLFISVGSVQRLILDYWDESYAFSLIISPIVLFSVFYSIVNGVLSYALSPMFGRDPQYYSAKLEEFFCIRRANNNYNRFFVVKFEDCPQYWRVPWKEFKRLVEQNGTVYKLTVNRGLFKMHFMRHKPEVELPISDEHLSQNRKAYQFLPNSARNSRIRNAAFLGIAGFVFLAAISAFIISIFTAKTKGNVHDFLGTLLVSGVLIPVCLALSIVFIVRLVKVGKADDAKPLPYRYKINYRAVRNAAAPEYAPAEDSYAPPTAEPEVFSEEPSVPDREGETEQEHNSHLDRYDEHKDDPYNQPYVNPYAEQNKRDE